MVKTSPGQDDDDDGGQGGEATQFESHSASPTSPLRVRQSCSPQDRPHSFRQHTYRSPTFCHICDGLLVGLWSQGHRCRHCGMDVHRGQGGGEHDNCRAEALLTKCVPVNRHSIPQGTTRDVDEEPEPELELEQAGERPLQVGAVLRQIRALAKDPNFLRECLSQADRDVKSAARSMVVATAVDEERGKNLRRLKGAVVPLVRRADAIAANGDLYVICLLLLVHAVATVFQTALSFVLFVVALSYHHGVLSSFQLAALHGSTVTTALHAALVAVAAVLHRLSALFKRKNRIIDRFLVDTLKINAETDIGVSVAGAARRCKFWSERALASSLISTVGAFLFWHLFWRQAQPRRWEAATLPPVASMCVPAAVFTLCSGVLAYLQGVGRTKMPWTAHSTAKGTTSADSGEGVDPSPSVRLTPRITRERAAWSAHLLERRAVASATPRRDGAKPSRRLEAGGDRVPCAGGVPDPPAGR